MEQQKLQFEKQVEADFEAKMQLRDRKKEEEIEQNKRNRALEFTKNEEEEIKECIKKCPSQARNGIW